MGKIERKQKLFTRYIEYSIDYTFGKLSKISNKEEKIVFESSNGISIRKPGISKEYEFIDKNGRVIATMKSKPVMDVDWALSLLDDERDLECLVLGIGFLLLI